MKHVTKYVTEVLLAMGAIAGTITATYVIVSYMDSIPDVHFSNATGTCVKVVSFDENEYTCDELPEKFNTVWTK